jgi:hypothetical protein
MILPDVEVRLRCLEAAAKTPMVHNQGHAVGVREVAAAWATWVLGQPVAKEQPATADRGAADLF